MQTVLSSSGNSAWWQVATGVLSIPIALLGLAYTYRLYQKTQLETRELRLKIIERERQLGLASTVVPEFELVDAKPSTQRKGQAGMLFLRATPWILGLLLIVLAARPQPIPISRELSIAGTLISFLSGLLVVYFLRRRKGFGEAWVVAAVFTATFLLSVLGWFFYLYLYNTRVVTIPLEHRLIKLVIGDDLTGLGLRYYCSNLDNPSVSPEEMIRNLGLNVDAVWTNASVTANGVLLLGSYSLAIFATVVSVLAGAQLFAAVRRGKSGGEPLNQGLPADA